MQKLLILFLAVVLTTSCSNNNTATKETKDSTAVKDTGSHVQPNGNTVTPPASNGQY